MSPKLPIALVQHNYKLADIHGNADRIVAATRQAVSQGARLVVFPEMAVTGYPADDLLLRNDFLENVELVLGWMVKALPSDADVIVGAPWHQAGHLYNAAIHIARGNIVHRYYKQCLPNYGVFDERRHFTVGDTAYVFEINQFRFGVTVCEDIWYPAPARAAAEAGANLLLNINASPFQIGKQTQRLQVLQARVHETKIPIAYLNRVGGQDELVFDGDTRVVSANGDSVISTPPFEEAIYFLDARSLASPHRISAPVIQQTELVWRALTTGLRDYVEDNRFAGVIVGLSGGIDSSVVLALAVDALGREQVQALTMPSQFTAGSSVEDAHILAKSLGVKVREIPITPLFETSKEMLRPAFEDLAPDTTEENLQARLRGNLLMAVANKHRLMVVGTSNKSEIAMGYTTLYGDSVGGYAPLKDVPKTLVYQLAEYCNRDGTIIPQRVIDRPPTAELAKGQLDTDSLPPYKVLDPILEQLMEHDASVEDLVAQGFDRALVRSIWKQVLASEYKRRQAPPGPKIRARAFGRERRYPITCFSYGKNRTS